MQPVIKLIDYTITDCTIKVQPQFAGVKPLPLPWKYGYKWDHNLRQFKEIKNRYRLNLSFTFDAPTKVPFPYFIHLELMGIFEHTPLIKTDNAKQYVQAVTLSGLAILYGVMRSLVSDITSQCYQGRFILPTINFVEDLKKKHK
ncbi:MAG: protein-export chaperone SecB [Candidatus Edwardsbacteria bacterium]|nr:protein-export chaperone SecB [Candidatus Edwardsbacteria bacterium]MBU1576849.1 protein-export chaperone SecB [Candidatus Edwardsbacteria bacterium]MBU2463810.1 protein-export chaperone SecB [Candidatus Edwardsbacteria bacterium]MBU2593382.1 protein-export chaperone SecB [Candidatus Edwardsbacteria bacterium]